MLLDSGRSSEVFLEGPDRVLKLYRAPFEAAAIANEHAATLLARRLGLPVAEPFGIVEKGDRMGILFERLKGKPIGKRYAYNALGFLLALRRLALIQHRIHAAPATGLPRQKDRLRHDIGWARVPDDIREAALSVLDGLPAGDRLCHGDIHPANVLCTRHGMRIIDWQKASVGDPAGDVARTELVIRHGRLGRGVLARLRLVQAARDLAASWYVRCYRRASGMPYRDIAAWHLPLTVARLCGRRTDMDAQILSSIDGLMRSGAADRASP